MTADNFFSNDSPPKHSGLLGVISRIVVSSTNIKSQKEWASRTEVLMSFLGVWSLPGIAALFVGGEVPDADATVFPIIWLAIVFIFTIDYLVQMSLSETPIKFVLGNPVLFLSFIFPPFRFLLSFGLVRRLFRKGGFKEFAIISLSFIVMAAFLVYYFERDAESAQILTRFDAFWWTIVTSTTVGFGDVVPVTTEGRIVAIGLMLVGISLYAALTARIAQNFILGDTRGADQHKGILEVEEESQKGLEEINRRLEHIEKLIEDRS